MNKEQTYIRELCIADCIIRRRDNGDLSEWFSRIDSLIFPTSEKAVIKQNGNWKECIVTGKAALASRDHIELSVIFSDATIITETRLRQSFLPYQ